jgi:hypothetical protein
MKRLATLIAAIVLASVPFAACGSDDGDGSPATTTERASAADRKKLLDCLRQARIRVVPSGKVNVTVEGRVPRVPVSAEYLGAAVLPSGGFFDLWLARDPETAAAAAEELNHALSEELGSEAVGAHARGPVVSAVGGNVQVNDINEVRAINRCSDSL